MVKIEESRYSQVFFKKKLILQRIQDIEDLKNIDLTNSNQHGFKRGKSTTTAGLAIQSALARALDLGQFALLANLDLSSAFDVVNKNLIVINKYNSRYLPFLG